MTRRPATADDLELLYHILRACMHDYVVQTWGAWDEAYQRARFDKATRPEHHVILECDGNAVGCLCLRRQSRELELVRLFVLPAFQNRRIGSDILDELTREADERGLTIRLRVLPVNPAQRLYARHGFSRVDAGNADDPHYTMVRPPRAKQ
jgi:N-acetylglutamate synthase-like GNAT family acetyltransferase